MKFIGQFTVVAICGMIYYFYISPTLAEVKVLSKTKSDYTEVVNKAKEIAKKRDAAILDFNSISSSDIDRLNKILPEKFDPVLFANDMTAMGLAFGLPVKDLHLDTAKTESRDDVVSSSVGQGFKTNIVGFKVSGTYNQFMKFLANLELSLRLVDITSLTIRPSNNAKTVDLPMEFLLEMQTYSMQ